ncbi:hypothetical protein AVEN_55515-1 [Araneus ventricosus]|uniref:Uncharacterized protein n=1 Tax=Araneus ventricosus TaxID=182803 RepID=A0A4Y2C982_ARAVE|nr:hypothetical protein AVEN_55515-1 [Araneus ventricosus]
MAKFGSCTNKSKTNQSIFKCSMAKRHFIWQNKHNQMFPRCFIKVSLNSLMLDKWQNAWTEGVAGYFTDTRYLQSQESKCTWNHGEERKLIFFTGHGPFPTYLPRFNLITSEYCSCGSIGSKLHYATECPLTEPWNLRKPVSRLIHVCLRRVAGNQDKQVKK